MIDARKAITPLLESCLVLVVLFNGFGVSDCSYIEREMIHVDARITISSLPESCLGLIVYG